MRLINPGVGELADRLTILQLKCLYGAEAGREIRHFKTEEAAILAQIQGRTLNGSWFPVVLRLGAVNAALWHEEDALRALRGDVESGDVYEGTLPQAARVAFRIQALNDRRAELIQEINTLTGDHLGEEKVIGGGA